MQDYAAPTQFIWTTAISVLLAQLAKLWIAPSLNLDPAV